MGRKIYFLFLFVNGIIFILGSMASFANEIFIFKLRHKLVVLELDMWNVTIGIILFLVGFTICFTVLLHWLGFFS